MATTTANSITVADAVLASDAKEKKNCLCLDGKQLATKRKPHAIDAVLMPGMFQSN